METREVVNEPVREVAPAVNVTPNPVRSHLSTPVDDEISSDHRRHDHQG